MNADELRRRHAARMGKEHKPFARTCYCLKCSNARRVKPSWGETYSVLGDTRYQAKWVTKKRVHLTVR